MISYIRTDKEVLPLCNPTSSFQDLLKKKSAMKWTHITILFSLFLGIFSQTQLLQNSDIDEDINDKDSWANTICGEPHEISGKTKCLCLKTLYEGNMCKFSDEIRKPFGRKCRSGRLPHCCNYMHVLAKKRDCPDFPPKRSETLPTSSGELVY